MPAGGVAVLLITDDSTRADITEAIGYLRAKQRVVFDAEVKAEIQDDIDALLDRLADAPR